MADTKSNATVHPVDDRVLITRQRHDSKIELPEHIDDPNETLTGVIAAIGPGMPTMTGERMRCQVGAADGRLLPVNPGDGVIYRAEDARELSIVSGKYDLVNFRDIICVLRAD